MKRFLVTVIAATLLLSGFAALPTEAESSQDESASTKNGEVYQAIGDSVFGIENATIDASVYLDYAAGIQAGVYQWVLSEDGSYYALAAIDENGEPITAEEAAINVGANNEERGGMNGGFGAGGQRMPKEGPDEGNGQQDGFGGMRGQDGMPDGMMGGQGGTVYQGVYMNANITNVNYQTMLIYVPAAYMTTDSDGNVTGIDHDAVIGNYTADTAPIVYLNECGGWRSSSPRAVDASYMSEGFIYVTAGARSRDAVGENGIHTGKAPTQVVDLKSGVIALRANNNVIPGDKERIISIGTSGGGQMSSIFGASGNMTEYYPYLYEAGAIGITKNADGTYSSAYPDHIFAAQVYCPIADIEDADLAYAWWWVDLADLGGTYHGSMTAFERRLQELEADAFTTYLNSLNLKDADGNDLTLTGLRSGTYYDAILNNISSALNAMVSAGQIDPISVYSDSSEWLTQNEDGTWQVTDLAAFMVGTDLVNQRNKAVPGFDPMDKSAENDAFGTPGESAVHYSRSVAQILSDHYDELSSLEGFNQEQVDAYINEALTGDGADAVADQANLLNATEIMLGTDGYLAVDPAKHWRIRSGTADQHTSFSIGYNIGLSAQSLGMDVDYHLVWDMGHGSNEGDSTGTFIDWINSICTK